jgi:Protein of unknown function (DUF2459)
MNAFQLRYPMPLLNPVLILKCSLLILFLCWACRPCTAATVWVARRGWHVDIGMEVADLQPPLASAALKLTAARYVFFGFGDRRYLLAKKHDAPVLLAAIWPGPGLILVTGLTSTPNQGFGAEHVIPLAVTAQQMTALQGFIQRSLETRDGKAITHEPGPYEDSMYLLASARYSGMHTCNTWVAEALRAGGFRVRSAGVVFAGQVWSRAKRLERAQRVRAPPAAAHQRPPEK